MSEYEDQAQAFLDKHGLKLRAVHHGDKCPDWDTSNKRERIGCPECGAIHGDRYRVTISRKGGGRIAFDFWNSWQDATDGKAPTAYDVLACISGDVFCPESFDEFCGEYGYDADSRHAERTFRRCNIFAKRLRNFFTTEEQSELCEIQ